MRYYAAICDMRYAICDMRYAISDKRYATITAFQKFMVEQIVKIKGLLRDVIKAQAETRVKLDH